MFSQRPVIEAPVTLEAAIHVLAAQYQNQALEDIFMRRAADRFAVTFWADVFSCHCVGPRHEQRYAGSESACDVERGLGALVE